MLPMYTRPSAGPGRSLGWIQVHSLATSEVDALKLQSMGARVLEARQSAVEAQLDERRARIELPRVAGTVLGGTP